MISNKIKKLEDLKRIAADAKKRNLTIVTTNGCFDIIHAGHVKSLEWAKSHGDILIVGVNSDASVREIKTPLRPIVGEKHRAAMLAALDCTDYVIIFPTRSPIPWLRKIKPHIHTKGRGSETSPNFLSEKKHIEAFGGKVLLAPKVPELSTTRIINKILKAYPHGK